MACENICCYGIWHTVCTQMKGYLIKDGWMCFLAVWASSVLNSCMAICNRKYNKYQRNELNIHLTLFLSGLQTHKQTLVRIFWMNSQILKFRSWSSEQFAGTSCGSLGPRKQMVMDLSPGLLMPLFLIFGDLSPAARKTGLCPTSWTRISLLWFRRTSQGKGNVGRLMYFKVFCGYFCLFYLNYLCNSPIKCFLL